MKLKAFIAFKAKLSNPWPWPCRSFIRIRLKRPIWVRVFRSRQYHSTPKKSYIRKKIFRALGPVLFRRSSLQVEEMDQLEELRSVAELERSRVPFPSPNTPAYIRVSAAWKKEFTDEDDVEDACRSFENYLMEMIVEEGKVRDLMDVEELLHCWKSLKSPVFTNMVSRFYGQVCKDLFSGLQGLVFR